DAFTSFEIISTEDLGFFPAGKGWQPVADGKTAPDGQLPINVSGGLKARGHPVGASGVAQVVEVARLMRGQGEIKLKREPRRGLAQSTGGLGANNLVTIVERADIGASPARAPLPPEPKLIKRRKNAAAKRSEEGTIETSTILYVTPDGFLPPLALALIRDNSGALVMAQGEDLAHLKIGRDVFLRQ